MVWDIVIAVVAGLAALRLAVIVAPWVTKGRFDLATLRTGLRMLPD
jgi:hypothetical protein